MANDELPSLLRKRGSLKSKLTIFINYLQPIRTSFELNDPITDSVIKQLKLRLDKLENIYKEYDSIQTEIECCCDETNLDEQYRLREEFENTYSASVVSAEEILTAVCKVSNNSHGCDIALGEHSGQYSQQQIKLPTIELPKYNGSHVNWLEFKDTFDSLIHNNASINNIQKYHYLRASLEGEALKVIQSLEFSSANYEIAWELLCKRFDNSRLLVHNHVKSIFEIENINKESATGLRYLIDTLNKHLRSLESLGQPTKHWDTLLIYIILTKLDKSTAREWEKHKLSNEVPTLDELQSFLTARADLLETLEVNHGFKNITHQNNVRKSKQQFSLVAANVQCYNCKKPHRLFKCDAFLSLNIPDRINKVRELNLCQNCLCSGHSQSECRARSCQKCNAKHNTLLHQDSPAQLAMLGCNTQALVLLSTAVIIVSDKKGNQYKVKALLDSGSQSCFISEHLCKLLNVPQYKINMSIIGINNGISNIRFKCSIPISSPNNTYSDVLNCLVVPKITDELPAFNFDISHWKIPNNIHLANPKFNEPSEIHILIGASHFWNILQRDSIPLGKNMPILQNTVFGYIVSGSVNLPVKQTVCNLARDEILSKQLQRFWEVEEINHSTILSSDDVECEQHFINNVSRTDQGRFVVRLPLKYPGNFLGNSKHTALRRFLKMEKKIHSNRDLRNQYSNFMLEYETMNHMSLSDDKSEVSYFLPHHGVLREESITTKLRVVFDGSAVTDSGMSLNDLQFTGPQILNDIFPILLRFRQHNFVVCADIAKMYRQILIHKDDRCLQKILWRYNQNDEISIYQLNTVTYGTKSAPYLAIRCLQQLASEFRDQFPRASEIILSDFYVDDLITGFQTEEEAITTANEISSVLHAGCFPLRKWNSNSKVILNEVRKIDDPINSVNLGCNGDMKTLGLRWLTNNDKLSFHVDNFCNYSCVTKRNILSDTAKLFDPLGLVSPCIVLCKIIIQKLWTLQLSWDEAIPKDLEMQWLKLRKQLPLLNELQVTRQAICYNGHSIELHGFCDASASAYGAVIYLKSIDMQKRVHVHILCSKTKVAPLKVLTTPRLELCGAVMLARLMKRVTESLTINVKCYLWCDSQIVLCWIKTQARLLQTFVSNRISEIQRLTEVSDWHYVHTNENPADIASRGSFPDFLIHSHMWWHGPKWILKPEYSWATDIHNFNLSDLPEVKKQTSAFLTTSSEIVPFKSFSNLTKLKNTMAYILRFIANCKLPKIDRLTGVLTVRELSNGMKQLVKLSQLESFNNEINSLNSNLELHNRNRLVSLCPFIDSDGLLRVGGRLKRSDLQFSAKHPLLLDGKHWLTRLIFEYCHKMYCHAPPQLLLSIIRQNYWPTSGMNVAKGIVRSCIKCFKFKPISISPIMADLPKERVRISSPFFTTGVDYAGPFILKDKRGRGSKSIKSYVCLFICFATRAIHLEVVTDLTTENFISAFRRFTSRRGKPSEVYSDNATNFVGAHKELKALQNFLIQSQHEIMKCCASEGINWTFIPPNSPHFGGIWEANIKQFKYHLLRVIGETKLTYEEFLTVVVQIEAILNSRPLYPMSSDPNDFQPLTPSHFLIGKPLIAIPDPSLKDIAVGRLSRFQLLQRINQDFWKAWSRDYLSNLQQRTKWRHQAQNLKNGMLVIVQSDNLPPCSWSLGRVCEIQPDSDGVVRVVKVKTLNGVFKRAVKKLCPLPIIDNN